MIGNPVHLDRRHSALCYLHTLQYCGEPILEKNRYGAAEILIRLCAGVILSKHVYLLRLATYSIELCSDMAYEHTCIQCQRRQADHASAFLRISSVLLQSLLRWLLNLP